MFCTTAGVLKGLNTSFAAAILRDPPRTNQMTSKRKEGRFRREMGMHLFRRMTRLRFPSLDNLLGGTATVPSEPPPRPSAPAPLQRIVKEGSSVPSSSRPPSRPRGRSKSMPSTHFSGESPQDPIRRRTKSAPQPPQSSRSASSHHPRHRGRSVPGEINKK